MKLIKNLHGDEYLLNIFQELDAILSAISFSEYRDFHKLYNQGVPIKYNGHTIQPNSSVKNAYSKIFRNKDRIVLPVHSEAPLYVDLKTNLLPDAIFTYYDLIYCLLISTNFFFVNTNKTDESEALEDVMCSMNEEALTKYYYKAFLDDGIYTFITEPKRKIRIGKILNFCKKNISLVKGYYKKCISRAIHVYPNTKYTSTRDTVIVISRHPYDIAGMSTGRGWSSCQNIRNGGFKHYVPLSIVGGCLIAYLCRKDNTNVQIGEDQLARSNKVNIGNPLGRVLIKPYIHQDEEAIDFINPNFILICSKAYGTFPKFIIDELQNWLDINWNNSIQEGNYKISPNVYREVTDETYIDHKAESL